MMYYYKCSPPLYCFVSITEKVMKHKIITQIKKNNSKVSDPFCLFKEYHKVILTKQEYMKYNLWWTRKAYTKLVFIKLGIRK